MATARLDVSGVSVEGGGGGGRGGSDGERGQMLATIVESLARSRENEDWGLIVEAAEDYQK